MSHNLAKNQMFSLCTMCSIFGQIGTQTNIICLAKSSMKANLKHWGKKVRTSVVMCTLLQIVPVPYALTQRTPQGCIQVGANCIFRTPRPQHALTWRKFQWKCNYRYLHLLSYDAESQKRAGPVFKADVGIVCYWWHMCEIFLGQI